jgi:hypothetical protein
LGPYNDSFVKTEVEVSESKINAIRETVTEMRRYGVNVSLFKSFEKKTNTIERYFLGSYRQLVN